MDPPRCPCRSIKTVFAPFLAAAMAAMVPAVPPPATNTSHSMTTGVVLVSDM